MDFKRFSPFKIFIVLKTINMNTKYIVVSLVVELQVNDVLQYSLIRKHDPQVLLAVADVKRTLPGHSILLLDLALLLRHLGVGHLYFVLTSALIRDPEVLCSSGNVAGVGTNAGEH